MTPRNARQFKEIRREKKALIMDVALEHFASRGFHTTTISHIARHAGISKGLLYNYFTSKEELLGEIINRSLADIYLSFDPDHDGYLSEEEFEHFVRRIFSTLNDNRQFWRLLFSILLQKGVFENLLLSAPGNQGKGEVRLKEFIDNMMALLLNYFGRKQYPGGKSRDPGTELLLFVNTIKGFAITLILSDDNNAVDAYEKTIEAIIRSYR